MFTATEAVDLDARTPPDIVAGRRVAAVAVPMLRWVRDPDTVSIWTRRCAFLSVTAPLECISREPCACACMLNAYVRLCVSMRVGYGPGDVCFLL